MRSCVMIIDDDPDFREMIAMVLAGWGLTCVGAATCADALPLLDRVREQLRVVLLDYFMPGLTPGACTQAILAKLDPGVHVVLVSAAVDIGQRAAELGLTLFLAKPFDTPQLRDLVLGVPETPT